MFALPRIFDNSPLELKPPKDHQDRPTVLASDMPINYSRREPRYQKFQDTLERHLNTIEQYDLLGFRSTQIAATQSLTKLDVHERFRLEVKFSLENQPLKRLLIASILNSEFHRDNQDKPHSGTRSAHALYTKGLLASVYEIAFLFRGLTPEIDNWFNTKTDFNVGHSSDYFTPKDRLFLRVVDREKLPIEKLSREDLIAWTNILSDAVKSEKLGFNQAYEIIKDLYVFRAIGPKTILEALIDSETTFTQRVLLSGAFSLLDTGLKNDLYPLIKPWLTSSNMTNRNLAVLLYWGSDSGIVANNIVQLLTPSEKLQSDPAYFSHYFFDALLLGCTLNPNQKDSNPISKIADTISKIFEARATENYDRKTREGLERQGTAKELRKRGAKLNFDQHGLVSAQGAKEIIYGALVKRLDREVMTFTKMRLEERQAAITAEAKQAVSEIFSINRAYDIAKLVNDGLTQNMLAEELFILAEAQAQIAAPSMVAMSAFSIHQGRQRNTNRSVIY